MQRVGEHTLFVMNSADWYNEYILTEFGKYKRKGEILEIGSGIGVFTKKLTKWGRVVGVEIDKEYLPKLRKLNSSKISTGFGDIESGKYFFSKKKFDTIVCLNVLEHIKRDDMALANISSLLKPRGNLFLLVPSHPWLYSKFDKLLGHYRRYTKKELSQKLAKAGFNIRVNKYFNWWGAIGWFFYLKVLGRKRLSVAGVGVFDKMAKFLLLPEKLFPPPFGISLFVVAEKKAKQIVTREHE